MAERCREQVTLEASLALIVVDDFTNCPVDGSSVRAWIEGEPPPVVKEGGYYVFINLRAPSAVIHLESEVFLERQIAFDARQLALYKGKELKIRMYPNRQYRLPCHTACIQGRAKAGSRVMGYSREYGKPLKLAGPYKAQDHVIRLSHPDDMDPEGRFFCIVSAEQAAPEVFRVTGQPSGEKKLYRLQLPLVHSYPSAGVSVYPVYVSKAGRDGRFYLPIPGSHTQKAAFQFWEAGKEHAKKQIELIRGTVNYLDMEG